MNKCPSKKANPIIIKSNNSLLLQQIGFISKLLFPKYPCHLFPIFCFLELLKKSKQNMKPSQIKLMLKPIPNKLYDILIENETIKSEHIVFVTEYTFDTFVGDTDFNYLNMILPNTGSNLPANNNICQNGNVLGGLGGSKNQDSQMVKVLPWKNCDSNVIFVKENFYENLKDNLQLSVDDVLQVSLSELPNHLSFPNIATKATVALCQVPYDLNADILEIIISKYFECPRLIHRNYLYEISLDENLLGSYQYSRNFNIFSHLKKIHFRIVNLESKTNDFEFSAVIAKNFTNLHQQSTMLTTFLPKQKLDNYAILPKIPFGLKTYANELRKCFLPFVQTNRSTSIKNFVSRNIYPMFLIHGDRGCGKFRVLESVANIMGIQLYLADCAEIVSQISAQTETKLKNVLNRPTLCKPLIICLQNFEIFGVDHDGHEDLRLITTFQSEICELFANDHNHPIIITALFNNREVHPMIQRLFLETIKIQSPTKDERLENLKWLEIRESFYEEIFNGDITDLALIGTRRKSTGLLENDKILEEIANSTQGFLFGDLKLLMENALKYMKSINHRVLRKEHIDKILSKLQVEFADSLGAPKVPKVLWSDIGGLAKLKEEIQSSIGLPLKHLHLMGKNMRRSGILLYGPPGTGKTLVAKAVATECNLSFLSVQGPELLNMYVGQSEQNVREVFGRARSAAPCVIFLDELDSLAPNRGVAGDSGGVMDRVVSQLLAEMDGMCTDSDPSKQVFILAATNRPDLIDPALLRPGRFDKLLYVGPCITPEDKLSVLKAITNKFNFDEKLKLETVAEILKLDMTGADLYSICSNAWLGAVRRTVLNKIHSKNSSKVIVNFDDFKNATDKFIPSISKKDLDYFNKLKANYSL